MRPSVPQHRPAQLPGSPWLLPLLPLIPVKAYRVDSETCRLQTRGLQRDQGVEDETQFPWNPGNNCPRDQPCGTPESLGLAA